MENQPEYCTAETLQNKIVSVHSPCAVLLENGPEDFSFVFASTFFWDELKGVLRMEQVNQLRLIPRRNRELLRRFREIQIRKMGNGIWIADDPETTRIFSSPSKEPYHILLI